MLNIEREERKKRRDSVNVEGEIDEDDGFSKPMMYLFDDQEL